MIHKCTHLIVTEQDAQLHTHVNGKVWDAASRLLNRCRRGALVSVMVTERERSMKLNPRITGRVF